MAREAKVAIDGRGVLRDRPEEDWFDASPEQLRSLGAWAARAHSDAIVNSLLGWLARRAVGQTSAPAAARYRAILREYGPPRLPRRAVSRPQKGVARNADNRRAVSRVTSSALALAEAA